ncbi:MAG TPA: SBBP repeat-containing protein [Bryobacteraceae bacterium]|nr:SBBP repeat-containing protein [Bryobacteraceae bacterium]
MLHPSRIWWALSVAGVLSATPVPEATVAHAKAALAQTPLRFESNQGQWRPDVRFRASSGAYVVSLTGRGASVALDDGREIEISMRGSNPSPVIQPAGELALRTNYFTGPKEHWHTGVANYSRVRYSAVYPGIDMVYYGNGRQLEYDFVLKPGADAGAIRMEFAGSDQVRVTDAGDLEVVAGAGRMLQLKPAIYQDGHPVAGGYVLIADNVVGVRLGAYNHKHELVVDPVLAYASYWGADATTNIAAVRLDAQGRLYMTGSVSNSDMGYIDGGWSNGFTAGSIPHIFLAIIDTTGKLTGNQFGTMYLTYIYGSNNDVPTGLQVDSQGNMYITGTTNSTNFPTVGNQLAAANATQTMGFVIQVNPNIYGGNSLLYSTFIGGVDGATFPYAVDVDSNQNIYVFGTTKTDDFPVTASAYQGVLWGPADMFLAELNPGATSYLYATYLGGELADDGRAMMVTPKGLVYFAGTTHSTQFPLAGNAYQNNLSGNGQIDNYDLIVGVIDPTKNVTDSLVYSTYLGGSDNEELRAITMDPKGNMVLTGYTLSTDYPTTGDAVQSQNNGNGDIFVTVVNPNANAAGFLVYSTYLGGSDGEVAYGVSADHNGYLYATGYTLSSDFPVQNAPQPNWGGLVNVFLAKLKPGTGGPSGVQFSTYLGGATLNQGTAMVVGPDGTVFTVGYTAGEFPTTGNANQHDFGGGIQNGFIAIMTQQ